MANWFSRYQGNDWMPGSRESGGHGFNELFRHQVLSLRERFNLRSVEAGKDKAIDPDYLVLHMGENWKAFAGIRELEWNRVDRSGGSPKVYFGALLDVHIVLAESRVGPILFADWVEFHFPTDFPLNRPQIRVQQTWKKCSYVRADNSLCVLNGIGEWNVKDNVCRAVEVAVEWVNTNHERGNIRPRN